MASPDALMLGVGAVSFAGSWKESGGFPENGYNIIGATIALTIVASTTRGTPIEPPVKALIGLMLLAVLFVYIPAFNKKGKANG